MSTQHKVGYFVGSLSSTSINRLLSRALIKLAPAELRMKEITYRELPTCSPDYVTVESTREFLRNYMAEFRDFVSRVRSVLPGN